MRKKRFLSLLVILAMIAGFAGMPVMAEEDHTNPDILNVSVSTDGSNYFALKETDRSGSSRPVYDLSLDAKLDFSAAEFVYVKVDVAAGQSIKDNSIAFLVQLGEDYTTNYRTAVEAGQVFQLPARYFQNDTYSDYDMMTISAHAPVWVERYVDGAFQWMQEEGEYTYTGDLKNIFNVYGTSQQPDFSSLAGTYTAPDGKSIVIYENADYTGAAYTAPYFVKISDETESDGTQAKVYLRDQYIYFDNQAQQETKRQITVGYSVNAYMNISVDGKTLTADGNYSYRTAGGANTGAIAAGTVFTKQGPVMIGNAGYDSLAQAAAAVKNGDVIEVQADLTETQTIVFPENAAVTVNGNGHKVTGDLANVMQLNSLTNLTVNDLTIESTNAGGRGIDVAAAAVQKTDLTLNNVNIYTKQRGITYTTNHADGSTLTLNGCNIINNKVSNPDTEFASDATYPRGISLWNAKNMQVMIKDSSIKGYQYALNTSGEMDAQNHYADASNAVITLDNSKLSGFSAFNIWSSGSTFQVINGCVLTGVNPLESGWNSFATIVVNTDIYNKFEGIEAYQNTINIVDSTITNYQTEASKAGGLTEHLIRVDAPSCVTKISLKGNTKLTDTTGAIKEAFYLGQNFTTDAQKETFITSNVSTDNTVEVTTVGGAPFKMFQELIHLGDALTNAGGGEVLIPEGDHGFDSDIAVEDGTDISIPKESLLDMNNKTIVTNGDIVVSGTLTNAVIETTGNGAVKTGTTEMTGKVAFNEEGVPDVVVDAVTMIKDQTVPDAAGFMTGVVKQDAVREVGMTMTLHGTYHGEALSKTVNVPFDTSLFSGPITIKFGVTVTGVPDSVTVTAAPYTK